MPLQADGIWAGRCEKWESKLYSCQGQGIPAEEAASAKFLWPVDACEFIELSCWKTSSVVWNEVREQAREGINQGSVYHPKDLELYSEKVFALRDKTSESYNWGWHHLIDIL